MSADAGGVWFRLSSAGDWLRVLRQATLLWGLKFIIYATESVKIRGFKGYLLAVSS